MESGLPTTLSVSMALHAAGLGLWLYMSQISKRDQAKVLSNVELMIAVRPAMPVRQGSSPPSTWNFLKMALPTAPARGPLDVETPREKTRPKFRRERMLKENRSKLHRRLELEAQRDMEHQGSLEALNAAVTETHVSHAKVVETARLADVGRRRASKAAIDMDALVDAQSTRGRRLGPQDISAMAAAEAPAHSHGPAPMAALSEEAAPVRRGGGGSSSVLESLLPSEPISSHGHGGPLSGGGDMEAAPAPARHKVEALHEKKKASMIEGPLKHRRVIHYEIPKFPAWAQQQGVLEAIVRIRFTVSPSGEVNDEMRLVQTSGFGELDRLAMDTLKNWRFQAKSEDTGNEWGVITFRFVLE